jgi:hypothetical protein
MYGIADRRCVQKNNGIKDEYRTIESHPIDYLSLFFPEHISSTNKESKYPCPEARTNPDLITPQNAGTQISKPPCWDNILPLG